MSRTRPVAVCITGGMRSEHPMIDHDFPDDPRLEHAYREAYRSLSELVDTRQTTHVPEDRLTTTEVIGHLRLVLDEAEMTAAARLGPIIGWSGPARDGDWNLVVAAVDFDGYDDDPGGIMLDRSASEGTDGRWGDSTLDRASRAYRRECRWDFSPGESGIWLLMLAPTYSSGSPDSDEPWGFSGHLVGFVIVQDRDEDGVYESVAHIWTASAWRRRGIAARLLEETRERFSWTGVEGPYTDDGAAFLRAVGVYKPAGADGEA